MHEYQEYPIPGVPYPLRSHEWNQNGGDYPRGTLQTPYMPPQAHPVLGREIYPMKAGSDRDPGTTAIQPQISLTGAFAGERNRSTKSAKFDPVNLGMAPPF